MQFPNGSGKRINMMYPVGNTFWTKLKAFVDYEPVSAIDPEVRGVLASIGIVKGRPFNPDAKQQALLKKAVETAPKMVLALRQLGRTDGRNLYYTDRKWENVWAGATADWFQDSYLDANQRATYFQVAYSSAPAMVMRTIGARSKYPVALRDANGEFLNGSNTYKLHLPPHPPAALFWAVTAYNITDGTMLETPQLILRSTVSTRSPPTAMARSTCGSGRPSPAKLRIRTTSRLSLGRILVALRLYGTGVEFFDQTWKPDDVVQVGVGGRALQ